MAWFVPLVIGAGAMAAGVAYLAGAKPARRRRIIQKGERLLERGERRLEKLESAAAEPAQPRLKPYASQLAKRREEGTIAGEREARSYVEQDPFAVERSYRRHGLDQAAKIEWKYAVAQGLDEVTLRDMKRVIGERAREEHWRTDVSRVGKSAPKARRRPGRGRHR